MLHTTVTVLLALVPPAGDVAPSAASSVPAVVRSLGAGQKRRVQDLRAKLRSSDVKVRKGAVRDASELGGEDALELVLEAFGDERGQVAEAAQDGLRRFDRAAVRAALAGDAALAAKDPWRRIRALESCAELGLVPDVRTLGKAFDKRAPDVARAAAVAVERLARGTVEGADPFDAKARARLAKDLGWTLKRNTDDDLRARGLLALAALDADAARDFELDRGAGGRTRGADLTLALRRGDADARERLGRALVAEDPGLRALALERVGEGHADRALLQAVVARLRDEPRPGVRERAARALRSATGLQLGRNAGSWERAVGELPEDWTPAPPSAQAKAREDDEASVAQLGALDPRSDRVALLVDFSGSQWAEQKDGRRAKDALDPEVEEYLGRLGEGARVWLMPFTHEFFPLTEEPIEVEPRALAALVEDFEGARMSGRGDLCGAVELALARPEIDRIVIVTDGAPSGGRRWNRTRIVDHLLESTRLRPVTFDLVTYGASKAAVRTWRRLTDETGGRLVQVD